MELLLFLSALLASLTGAISGDRSAELRTVRQAQMASVGMPARPCAQAPVAARAVPAAPGMAPLDLLPPIPRGSEVRTAILLVTQRWRE